MTLSQSVRPVPHLDRNDSTAPSGAAEVVAGGSATVEGSATCAHPGSTASAQAAGMSHCSGHSRPRRAKNCSQLSTPARRLEPATLPEDTPHALCHRIVHPAVQGATSGVCYFLNRQCDISNHVPDVKPKKNPKLFGCWQGSNRFRYYRNWITGLRLMNRIQG
jgi:hypothetical protein